MGHTNKGNPPYRVLYMSLVVAFLSTLLIVFNYMFVLNDWRFSPYFLQLIGAAPSNVNPWVLTVEPYVLATGATLFIASVSIHVAVKIANLDTHYQNNQIVTSRTRLDNESH